MVKKDIVVQTLKSLEKGGMLTPYDVVNEAKKQDSPIHECFLWNDAKAAHEYRLWQARELIASVRVELFGKECDGYINILTQINDEPLQGYFSMEKVLSEKALLKKVIQDALREIEYWEKKYKEIIELKDLIDSKKVRALRRQFA